MDKIKTVSIFERKSKVNIKDLGKPVSPNKSVKEFFDSLPNIFASKDLKEFISICARAIKHKKIFTIALGAHVIKNGCSPYLLQLIDKGCVSAVILNGACLVHDFELAFAGKTSEIVEEALVEGEFGITKETSDFLNSIVKEGVEAGFGLGEAVKRGFLQNSSVFKYPNSSLILGCAKGGVEVLCFSAVGTDVIHIHPSCEGASFGLGSQRDLKRFAEILMRAERGVHINFGSAVILPEVFLKAISWARNVSGHPKVIYTAVFDFIKMYRPHENVVYRPTKSGGKGFYFVGHHEIMIPLFVGALLSKLGVNDE